ncbi:MAG: hypothetical protein KIY11_00835 [Thermoplasmata archaeon]|nr:hypothetical protein [Candidatus Sysuiplasma acidicola]
MSREEEQKAGPAFWIIVTSCLISIIGSVLIALSSSSDIPPGSMLADKFRNSSSGKLLTLYFPYSGIDVFLTLAIPLVLLFLVVLWARSKSIRLVEKRSGRQ